MASYGPYNMAKILVNSQMVSRLKWQNK